VVNSDAIVKNEEVVGRAFQQLEADRHSPTDDNAIGIDARVGGVVVDPAQDATAVIERSREGALRRETTVDAHHDYAQLFSNATALRLLLACGAASTR